MGNLNIVIQLHARTCRNELADDNVFLEAEQRIDLALDGGIGQNARRLLEGSSGQEAVGRQRRLCDTEQDWGDGRFGETLLAGGDTRLHRLVGGSQLRTVDD